jgi:hypothetical protein
MVRVSSATDEQLKQVAAIFSGKPKRRTLITTPQACAILDNCHPITLQRYEKRGLLHPIRFSKRKKRFDLDEVETLASNGANITGGAEA